MKPDYKNWVPRGLLFLLGGMAIICLAVCAVFGIAGVATEGGLRIALGVLFGAAFLLFAKNVRRIICKMFCALKPMMRFPLSSGLWEIMESMNSDMVMIFSLIEKYRFDSHFPQTKNFLLK